MPQKRDRNSDFSKDFKKKLSELRKETGMTQIEFAKFVGVSSSSIGLYETGERIPDAEILCRIAKKCNVSADYLLGLQKSQSLSEDIKIIYKYTGLSEEAIEVLHKYSSYEPDADITIDDCRFILNYEAVDILSDLLAGNVLHDLMSAICSVKDYKEEYQGIIAEVESEIIDHKNLAAADMLHFSKKIEKDLRVVKTYYYDAIDGFRRMIDDYIENYVVGSEDNELIEKMWDIHDELIIKEREGE